ncbi:MAG: ABC transporter substrate-binding protein [Candidatus Binatia bacterium]
MFGKPTVFSLRGLLIPVVPLILLTTAPLAQPAETPARSPALQKIIEGAKKEGALKVQWLAGRLDGEAGLRPMVAAMNKMYGTNVKLQYTPGPNFPTMLNKITQEKAAGVASSTDINLMTSNHVSEGTKNGVLRKMDWGSILEQPSPPDAKINRVAPEGTAVMIASRIVGIPYNTNLVKGDDIPASMEDVFKPKWKGKIASTPFATGLYQFAAKDMLGYEYMKNYTQRLAKQIGGLTDCSNIDRISSGEFTMMVFDCGHDDTLRYQKRGAPVAHATIKEIARINILYMGVPVHAQHPNAATLFINFMNTREGQALQWEHARHDLHIYPEAQTRKPVQRIIDARGKLAIETVERELALGHEEVNRLREEFVKILKEGGR